MELDTDTSERLSDMESALVKAAIQDYFEGMYHGDLTRLKKAFFPSAKLYGYRYGAFIELTLEHWLERISTRPIPAQTGEPFDMVIESIDLTGSVGNVKVRDLYMGLRFTDYLHVAKVDGRWQIVNKTFHHD